MRMGPIHRSSSPPCRQALYGAGPLIQLLLGSGAHHYMEFKLLQGSYLLELGSGGAASSAADAAVPAPPELRSVPSSRSAVFQDRRLSPLQKRGLMRFLKAAAEALEGQGPLKVRPLPGRSLRALGALGYQAAAAAALRD